MNYSYLIDAEKRLIALKFVGELSLSQVIRSSEILWQDPRYDPSFPVICDLTEISARAHVRDVPELLAFYNRPETSSGRLAIVLTEPVSTALAFLFRSTAPMKFRVGLFSTWEAACGFLHIDLEDHAFVRVESIEIPA